MATIKYKNGSNWVYLGDMFFPVGSYAGSSLANVVGGTWQSVSTPWAYGRTNTAHVFTPTATTTTSAILFTDWNNKSSSNSNIIAFDTTNSCFKLIKDGCMFISVMINAKPQSAVSIGDYLSVGIGLYDYSNSTWDKAYYNSLFETRHMKIMSSYSNYWQTQCSQILPLSANKGITVSYFGTANKSWDISDYGCRLAICNVSYPKGYVRTA